MILLLFILAAALAGCHGMPGGGAPSPMSSPTEVSVARGVELPASSKDHAPYLFAARWQRKVVCDPGASTPSYRVLVDPYGAARWAAVATLGGGLLESSDDSPPGFPVSQNSPQPLMQGGAVLVDLSWPAVSVRLRVDRAETDVCWMRVTFQRGDQYETICFDRPVSLDKPTMLWVPLDPRRLESGYVRIQYQVLSSTPGDMDLDALLADWAQESDPVSGSLPPSWRGAIANLERPLTRTGALLYVGDRVGALWIAELAFVASADSLEEIARELRSSLTESGSADSSLPVEIRVPRSVLRALARRGRQLEPAERYVLRRRFGAVGSFPASLEEMAEHSSTVRALDLNVRDENFVFLQSASPAVRLAALDWLRERGDDPEGYDPMGSPGERRAAIERALEQRVAGPLENQAP